MKKKVKLTYPTMGGTCRMNLPKFMLMETNIWGDSTVEVENIGEEIIIRKCEEGLSESLRLARLFQGTDFLSRKRNKGVRNGN